MKDLYAILGVGRKATTEEIRTAFKKRVKVTHPDKIDIINNNENKSDAEIEEQKKVLTDQTTLLNEAHGTLIDPEKRRKFDDEWAIFQLFGELDPSEVMAYYNEIRAANSSEIFEYLRAVLVARYGREPLVDGSAREYFASFDSGIYPIERSAVNSLLHNYLRLVSPQQLPYIKFVIFAVLCSELIPFLADSSTLSNSIYATFMSIFIFAAHLCYKNASRQLYVYGNNLFTFIEEKTNIEEKTKSTPLEVKSVEFIENLTPESAVNLFTKFLEGRYYGGRLTNVRTYLHAEIEKIRQAGRTAPDLLLYEGISEIISTATIKPGQETKLLSSLNKITEYAKNSASHRIRLLGPLFRNQYFRHFFARALHLYWQSSPASSDEKSDEKSNEKIFEAFNGQGSMGKFAAAYSEKFPLGRESKTTPPHLKEKAQQFHLLFQLQKQIYEHEDLGTESRASFFREKAFHIINSAVAFEKKVDKHVIVNLFIQAGTLFQRATLYEPIPSRQMADENMALTMYIRACQISRSSTPDIELYACIHSLKFLAAFQFQNPELQSDIRILQLRALKLAKIFPFVELIQPHLALFTRQHTLLSTMGPYLRNVVEQMDSAKELIQTDQFFLDLGESDIRHYVYEAMLHNWYQEHLDTQLEQRFKLKLMEALLAKNNWTFLDLNKNINSPWIMVERGVDGWMEPSTSLRLPYDRRFRVFQFQSLDGIELDFTNGKLDFLFNEWTRSAPGFTRLLTLFDVVELLEKNISNAVFSLDPPDPNFAFHPFNLMRINPARLYQTELMHSLFLADYLLKFFTMNQEVRGRYPYDTRPIDFLINHLPERLKNIIVNFHKEQKEESIHRFWIEAEEMPVAFSEEASYENGAFSLDMKQATTLKVALGETKMIVKKHRMERSADGKLVDKEEQEEGWELYVFSQDQKIDVKKLKKPAMIFFPEEQKHSQYETKENKEGRIYFLEKNDISPPFSLIKNSKRLNKLLEEKRDEEGRIIKTSKNSNFIYGVTRDITRRCKQLNHFSPEYIFSQEFTENYDEFARYFPVFGRVREFNRVMVIINILNIFERINKARITKLKDKLNDSSGVAEKEQKLYEMIRDDTHKNFSQWSEIASMRVLLAKYQNELVNIQRQMGGLWPMDVNQRKNYKEQLCNIYSSKLKKPLGERYTELIDRFLDGELKPLASALTEQDRKDSVEQIQKLLSDDRCISLDDIGEALDGSSAAINRISAKLLERANKEAINQMLKNSGLLTATFEKIGLNKKIEEPSLAEKCLWVPANIHHEAKGSQTSLVYGGVHLASQFTIFGAKDPRRARTLVNVFAIPDACRVSADTLSVARKTTVTPDSSEYISPSVNFRKLNLRAEAVEREAERERKSRYESKDAARGFDNVNHNQGSAETSSQAQSTPVDSSVESKKRSETERYPYRERDRALKEQQNIGRETKTEVKSGRGRGGNGRPPRSPSPSPFPDYDSDFERGSRNQKGDKEKPKYSKKYLEALKKLEDKLGLPMNGEQIRFVPPAPPKWYPSMDLPRGDNHGFLDRYGNEWCKGSSRTAGEFSEWDIQLSDKCKRKLGKQRLKELSRDGEHINVSLTGRITHR